MRMKRKISALVVSLLLATFIGSVTAEQASASPNSVRFTSRPESTKVVIAKPTRDGGGTYIYAGDTAPSGTRYMQVRNNTKACWYWKKKNRSRWDCLDEGTYRVYTNKRYLVIPEDANPRDY